MTIIMTTRTSNRRFSMLMNEVKLLDNVLAFEKIKATAGGRVPFLVPLDMVRSVWVDPPSAAFSVIVAGDVSGDPDNASPVQYVPSIG